MKTYNTYKEAKEKNPDSEIVTTGPDWEHSKDLIGKFQARDFYDGTGNRHRIGNQHWVICNPEDYEKKKEHEELEAAYDLYKTFYPRSCITLEDFAGSEIEPKWIRVVRKTNYRVK